MTKGKGINHQFMFEVLQRNLSNYVGHNSNFSLITALIEILVRLKEKGCENCPTTLSCATGPAQAASLICLQNSYPSSSYMPGARPSCNQE